MIHTHRDLISSFHQIWVIPTKRLCYLTSKLKLRLAEHISFSHFNVRTMVQEAYLFFEQRIG